MKSVASVAVLAGVSAALVLPGQDSALALAAPDAGIAQARVTGGAAEGTASRGSERVSVVAPAVTGVGRDAIGVAGLKAVISPELAALDPELVGQVGFSTTAFLAQGRAKGLVPNAQRAYSAVRSAFGITTIGGLRPGDPLDHGTGHAIDVMITSQAQGDAVAAFVLEHAAELNVKYVIWRQRSWKPERGAWRLMEDRGSITQNHFDHVHVSVR